MKSNYVADLTADQIITCFFLVCEKEIRTGTSGKPYLRLSLGDRTGLIEGRMWENFEEPATRFNRDDVVKVQGRVDQFRGRNQLIIEKVRRAEPHEIEIGDYLPHTVEDVEKLYVRLREHVAGVTNPWLKRVLTGVIEDPDVIPRLKRAPAAKSMHHAYIGGLLEHIVSLCGLCRAAAAHYPEADVDLLIAAAVLHDIGKLDELSYDRSFSYTTEGQLLGHIIIEVESVGRRLDAIAGFPQELKTLLKHILISHHGRPEFGAAKIPMFREALMFHYLDDLDSKMAAMRTAFASEGGEAGWTAWNAALERRMFRAEEFLQGKTAGGAALAPEAPQQLRLDAPPQKDGKGR